MAGTAQGGCGQAGGGVVAFTTFGAHFDTGTGDCHLENDVKTEERK